tara:strand:- start:1403 stop:1945 length:543 start_codon:yes stop_codon:yes gene_type:complete
MNKKEKFYKNLSEFNIQKVELKDMKTLEKLHSQINGLLKEYGSQIARADSSENKFKSEESKLKEQRNVVDSIIDFIEKKREEAKKEEARLETALNKERKTGQKLIETVDKALLKLTDDTNELKNTEKEMKRVANVLETSIKQVEQGARELGIDLGNKLSKYKSRVADIDSIKPKTYDIKK